MYDNGFPRKGKIQNQIPFCFDAFQNPPYHNLESANLRLELLHTGTSGLITLQTRELHYANIINLVNGSITSFQRRKKTLVSCGRANPRQACS
jgi:hypothetical protein